ncbi:[Fe-Fe] hydrogenase large subunit C-terminal domain-containing protein [Desulfurispora thermophila]|uniref:[Fe-Fe] hydrogenase large subunit C-terminal domain-containing protein n=1 Tax=Desulfurispora thermophila TaxID=265470 RepID=UPI00037AE09F|nr:[Fe-Fe] hydrogenase large subunit C-terminal domain-containing protein [Desulfurispora thermophila]
MFPIITNQASCRDCYRCVRSCPVKAISIRSKNGNGEFYAQIIEDICVLDGRCVQVCPQQAKKVSPAQDRVRAMLKAGEKVAVSLAPSFAAALPLSRPRTLVSMLKKLGFAYVSETSLGAEMVSAAHKELGFKQPYISSACPVVVNLIEKHFPDLIPYLAPLVSPMIAHGRYLKRLLPDHKVVFIGPCIAKKAEITCPELAGAVDEVMGFQELWEWLTTECLCEEDCEEAGFDGPQPALARLYPVDGGMLRTIAPSTDILESKVITVTGLKNCWEFLQHLQGGFIDHPPYLMELLACNGGCISGPLSVTGDDIYVKRQKIQAYYRSCLLSTDETCSFACLSRPELPADLLRRSFTNKKLSLPNPSEQEIRDILAQTGKYTEADELNCGACGYNSCRDKAVAVYHGMAEVQMCMPYMRKRAESLSNLVLSSMPNGVVIVDYKLRLLEINPAAEKMFNCTNKDVAGKHISFILAPQFFEQVLESKTLLNVQCRLAQGMVTRQVLFPVEREKIIVCIIVDITDEEKHKEQLAQVRSQTIERAQAVIEKQMKVAQEIAGLLGETTAETKMLLSKLINLMKEQ